MGRQNEFYKKTHPEQFSDSVLVKKGNLSRDMFDYYLESLTSKNLEKTFEEFCRKLAESEVQIYYHKPAQPEAVIARWTVKHILFQKKYQIDGTSGTQPLQNDGRSL